MKKLQIKTVQIELDGDYEGWQFEARTNLPMAAWADIMSGNFDRIITGLSEALLVWNFVDEDGDPLPDLAEARKERKNLKMTGKYKAETDPVRAAVGRLPFDLAIKCAKSLDKEIGKVDPN